jgi:hypothetical protein
MNDCAWCLEEAGIVPESGSHGICEYHSAEMRMASAMRQFNRVASYVETNAAEFADECTAILEIGHV